MKSYTLFLYFFATIGCCLSYGEIYKCNPEIEHKIKHLLGNHYQRDIIETATANRQEVVIAATPGYYSTDAECVYSIFHKEPAYSPATTVSVYEVFKNGSVGSRDLYISEFKGSTYDYCNKIRRYHVFYKNGVTAVYVCSEAPDANPGIALGFIKIRASDNDYTAVDEARQTLQELGISVSADYPWECPGHSTSSEHQQ